MHFSIKLIPILKVAELIGRKARERVHYLSHERQSLVTVLIPTVEPLASGVSDDVEACTLVLLVSFARLIIE